MKSLQLLCIVALITFAINGISCKVLELNEGFAQAAKDGIWLVMFYAPWCGHCKKLEPTWVNVGAILDKEQPDVRVARLDATRYTSLAGLYKIKGFPTIKFFKNGHAVDYNGARNEKSIISFVNRAKRPPVTYLRDHIALQKARESHEVFFVYIGSDSDPLQKKYTSTAAILFTRLSFFSIERNKLPSDIITRSENTIMVFKDGNYYEIPQPLISGNIVAWMMEEQFRTYNHLTAISFHELRASGKPYAIAVVEKNSPFNVTMQGIAFKRSYPYTFCWVEGNQLVNSITYASISVPNLVVYDEKTRDYYVMHEENPVAMTKANVEEFFDKIFKGEQPARGGSSIKEQAKRAMGDFANFFLDLFTDSPILGIVVVLVPSFIVVVCCVCCCTISDDGDMSSEMDSEDDFDYEEEAITNPDDVETRQGFNENLGEPSTEGLRQRIKEVRKE